MPWHGHIQAHAHCQGHRNLLSLDGNSRWQAGLVLNHDFADGQALGLSLKAWPEASSALLKINQKIPSTVFCCCTVLRGHWTPFPPLPKEDLPVPFPAVAFARTEQALGGESVQWWQEATSAKPHSQGCLLHVGPKLRRKLHPHSGQDWSHVRGVTSWRDTPRYTEMFLGRERKRNSVTSNLRENVPSRELRL